jgi:hypothetical protein
VLKNYPFNIKTRIYCGKKKAPLIWREKMGLKKRREEGMKTASSVMIKMNSQSSLCASYLNDSAVVFMLG